MNLYVFKVMQKPHKISEISEFVEMLKCLQLGLMMHVGFEPSKRSIYSIQKDHNGLITISKDGNFYEGLDIANAVGWMIARGVQYTEEEQEKERTRTRLQKYVEDVFSGQWSDIFPSEYFCIGQELDLLIINSHDEVLAEVAKGCDSESKVSEAIADYITKRAIRINDFAMKFNTQNNVK